MNLKIEEIKTQKPEYLWREQRCSKHTRSTGTSYFKGNINQCGRLARFKIDGTGYCTQHAGEVALKHLIDKQEALL